MSTQIAPVQNAWPPPIGPDPEHAPDHELRICDRTGDMKIAWDAKKPEEVATAKQAFETWRTKGYAAYKTKADGSKGEVIRTFDPDAERITLAPPMVGG